MASTKQRAPATGDRVVFADKSGQSSKLLPGDPEKDERGVRALPELLAEGWTVKSCVTTGEGAYFIITSKHG